MLCEKGNNCKKIEQTRPSLVIWWMSRSTSAYGKAEM